MLELVLKTLNMKDYFEFSELIVSITGILGPIIRISSKHFLFLHLLLSSWLRAHLLNL